MNQWAILDKPNCIYTGKGVEVDELATYLVISLLNLNLVGDMSLLLKLFGIRGKALQLLKQ